MNHKDPTHVIELKVRIPAPYAVAVRTLARDRKLTQGDIITAALKEYVHKPYIIPAPPPVVMPGISLETLEPLGADAPQPAKPKLTVAEMLADWRDPEPTTPPTPLRVPGTEVKHPYLPDQIVCIVEPVPDTYRPEGMRPDMESIYRDYLARYPALGQVAKLAPKRLIEALPNPQAMEQIIIEYLTWRDDSPLAADENIDP